MRSESLKRLSPHLRWGNFREFQRQPAPKLARFLTQTNRAGSLPSSLWEKVL